MKRLRIVFVLLLVGLGAGVVRPRAMRAVDEAWRPVVESLDRVPFALDQSVELDPAGDYVVFVEAPATDALWSRPGGPGAWVQLVSDSSHQALPSTTHGVDYDYELDGRRGVALSKVTARVPARYLLDVSAAGSDAPHALAERGVQVAVGPAGPVDEQAWRSSIWFVAGIGACSVIGLAAFALLMKGE